MPRVSQVCPRAYHGRATGPQPGTASGPSPQRSTGFIPVTTTLTLRDRRWCRQYNAANRRVAGFAPRRCRATASAVPMGWPGHSADTSPDDKYRALEESRSNSVARAGRSRGWAASSSASDRATPGSAAAALAPLPKKLQLTYPGGADPSPERPTPWQQYRVLEGVPDQLVTGSNAPSRDRSQCRPRLRTTPVSSIRGAQRAWKLSRTGWRRFPRARCGRWPRRGGGRWRARGCWGQPWRRRWAGSSP